MSWLRAGSLVGTWWFFEPVFLKCGYFVDENRFLGRLKSKTPETQKPRSARL